MLGVALVVWFARRVHTQHVEVVARARAVESCVFVAVWRDPDAGGAFVVDPHGRVIARAPAGRDYALGAACLLADAQSKSMAPGTDVWDTIGPLQR